MTLFPFWLVNGLFLAATAACAAGTILLLILLAIDLKKRQMW